MKFRVSWKTMNFLDYVNDFYLSKSTLYELAYFIFNISDMAVERTCEVRTLYIEAS
jgi:ACT domain-containing protein